MLREINANSTYVDNKGTRINLQYCIFPVRFSYQIEMQICPIVTFPEILNYS